MGATLVVGLVAGFIVGRIVQWVKDANRAMASHRGTRR